ncbi:MAG: hypothetical protein F6K00_00920 [Leptolyngbya sp. SIOISBB]|nr:hypothetical protein [Leptolyngbya sp. SIOISBB]
MAYNTAVMEAVESLKYRVTVGDVATQSGLELAVAQQGLNALAADTQAHLQVSDTGEIAYEFPKSFRAILRNKYWRLRLQETWERIWSVLFYLIRISFGILLIVSILVIVVAILVLVIAAQAASQKDDDRGGGGGFGGGFGGGGMVFMPRFWIGDLFWLFHYDPYYSRRSPSRRASRPNRSGRADDGMNFLEAIFSFLFGDGDPNADLEERRWQEVGAVIQNNGGAIAAEQVVPYLDDLGKGWSQEDEDYILPVLTRFNGVPEVSPQGDIIYHFPELQVTAQKQRGRIAVPAYLKEAPRKFSEAKMGQLSGAIALGVFNFLGAIVLGVMLQDQALVAEIGGFIGFVNAIYWVILAYGAGFLAIPAGRYFWTNRKNSQIESRNEQRQERALALNAAGPELDEKITFAQQFAAQTVVSADDLAYTTEKDLTEQEYEQRDKLDAEWQKRLESSEDAT